MDNSQKGQSSNDNGFFVSNPSDPLTSQNPEPGHQESDNSYSLNSDEVSWVPERDNKSIGTKAILSGEAVPKPDTVEILPPPEPTPEIQVADEQVEPLKADEPQTEIPPFDEKLIRTEGERISRAALVEIGKAEDKLTQTGDINDFYDEMRDMMEKNLENSYDRKLGS